MLSIGISGGFRREYASDLLRLLDGLLRFKHPAFNDTLLDEIERFLDGITEHTFGIRERLAAIRAHRLRNA